MPKYAGKSAAGKGSPKAGYLMPGSTKPASTSGGHPPKGSSGIIRKPKAGK